MTNKKAKTKQLYMPVFWEQRGAFCFILKDLEGVEIGSVLNIGHRGDIEKRLGMKSFSTTHRKGRK